MYWNTVTPCSRQSSQNWPAENLDFSTTVAPAGSAEGGEGGGEAGAAGPPRPPAGRLPRDGLPQFGAGQSALFLPPVRRASRCLVLSHPQPAHSLPPPGPAKSNPLLHLPALAPHPQLSPPLPLGWELGRSLQVCGGTAAPLPGSRGPRPLGSVCSTCRTQELPR